ncbi:MAG: hypothetical protein JRN15_09935 [Nitrososphaerota archaeon]|nr:hypothetical protein [Nitrososphaerota archaeon]
MQPENAGKVLLVITLGFALISVGVFFLVSDLVSTNGENKIELYASTGLVLFGCLATGQGLSWHAKK